MKKVLILFGGNSYEHGISCKSAKSILKNIDKKLFDITSVAISRKNKWFIYNDDIDNIEQWYNQNITEINNIIEFLKTFDVVFPVLHGYGGEDGKLQGMLDLFNIKYVGCNTLSSAICMDKIISKYIFSYLSIPQVPFIEVNKLNNIKTIVKTIGFPAIVKPANGGSSIGINKVNNQSELKYAIKEAFKYDKKVLVEKYIVARELECAVIEDKEIVVSTIGEIKSANEFYDYNAKYENKESFTVIPANLDDDLVSKIKEYAKKAFLGANCSSLARIDFLYDESNKIMYLNEINTLPGFTDISMYPLLFINDGYTYKETLTKLINSV